MAERIETLISDEFRFEIDNLNRRLKRIVSIESGMISGMLPNTPIRKQIRRKAFNVSMRAARLTSERLKRITNG